MEKLVIGIHGKSEHGKTTFEKIVAKIKPCQCFAFADSLKEYCAKITGLPFDYFYHRKDFTLPDIKVPLDTLVKHLWDFYQEIFSEQEIQSSEAMPQVMKEETKKMPQGETKKTQQWKNPNIRKKISYEMFRKRLDLGLEREFRSFYVDEELFLGHITIGLLLQMIGTDVVRNYICDEFWILLLSRKIQKSSASLILVTDVRDPKEKLLIDIINSVDSENDVGETSKETTLKGKTNDVEQTSRNFDVNRETLTNYDVESTLNVEYKKQNDDTESEQNERITSEQERSKNGETIQEKEETIHSIVLRMERQELANKSRRNNHVSEIALDHTSMYTLENYGTREELETNIRRIFDGYTPNRVIERIKNLPYRKSIHDNV